MIDSFVSSIFWTTLVVLDAVISIRLALMYRRDYDTRKLMFIIGLIITSQTYIVTMYGITSSPIARRIFEWCPLPILFAFIFSILNDRFSINLTKYYRLFLGVVAVTIAFFLFPFRFLHYSY